jgi:hypothetical protein
MRLPFFRIGTTRLACSLAAHYDRQQEQTEDKTNKGKKGFEIYCLSSCRYKLRTILKSLLKNTEICRTIKTSLKSK